MNKVEKIENAFKKYESVDEITKSNERTVEWLQKIGGISNFKLCPCCSWEMHTSKEKTKNDGIQWLCVNKKCRKRLSIRNGTMLMKHDNIPLIILSRLIFIHFAQGTNARSAHIILREQLGDSFEISYETVKKIYSDIRTEILNHYLYVSESKKLGGEGSKVEIDESIFSHLTFKTSKKIKKTPIYVLGMIDTNTNEIRVIVVPNREKFTLEGEILKNVKPKTKIVAYGFDGYNSLPIIGYSHEVLNKKLEGLGKGEKVTSHIESVWSQLKQYAGIYNKSIPAFQANEFLAEFWFRREIRRRGLEIITELARAI